MYLNWLRGWTFSENGNPFFIKKVEGHTISYLQRNAREEAERERFQDAAVDWLFESETRDKC
jgi:hypothetical protein